MGVGKPRGAQAARALKNRRRMAKWASKPLKKKLMRSYFKQPLGGSSQATGLVTEKVGIEAKQPNSAIRKCVRVLLKKNSKKITAFVPRDGCLNFINDNDQVMVCGFGRKGHAVGDIPGVRFKVISVKGISLKSLYLGKKDIRR